MVSGRTLGGRTENSGEAPCSHSQEAHQGEQSREPSSSAAGFWVDINTTFLQVSSVTVGSELTIFTRQV